MALPLEPILYCLCIKLVAFPFAFCFLDYTSELVQPLLLLETSLLLVVKSLFDGCLRKPLEISSVILQVLIDEPLVLGNVFAIQLGG